MNYLAILLLLLAFTLFIEWKFHIHLYRSRKERWVLILFFFAIGVLWDSYAIINGHWLFPAEKTLGIHLGVMPIEEYLFILILPFWIITTYKIVHEKLKLR